MTDRMELEHEIEALGELIVGLDEEAQFHEKQAAASPPLLRQWHQERAHHLRHLHGLAQRLHDAAREVPK